MTPPTKRPSPPIGGQNWLDKAIAVVAPGMAAGRLAARSQLALSGGYTGARIDRAQLSRWMPSAGSANADTIQTQYWAMVAAGSAAFTSPKNTTHTVQPTKDVSCSQKAVKKNSTTLLYDIDFTVEEVT